MVSKDAGLADRRLPSRRRRSGGTTVFARARLEGIVSKRLDAPYRSGPSKTWLKSKNPLSEAVRRGTRRGLELKYRDVEYTVVQGIERQLWKWGFALEGKAVTGQAVTKAEAVAE